jgi:xylulokinase
MKTAVLCADIGTSSLKAGFIGIDGTVFAFSRTKFDPTKGSNRWLDALATCTKSMASALYSSYPIELVAISISGNGPSLTSPEFSCLWDEKLCPEAEQQLQKLATQGKPNTSIFIPRLLHIKYQYPDQWEKTPIWYSVPEYLVYQLTGIPNTSLPEQRYESAYWTPESLENAELTVTLPPFNKVGNPTGNLTEEGKKILEIPLTKGSTIPVFCGGPDFTTALIGTGTLHPGAICDRAGTSEGINVCTSKPLVADSIRTLPSPMPSLWNGSVLIADSGSRFSHWKAKSCYSNATYQDLIQILCSQKNSEGYQVMMSIAKDVSIAYEIIKKAVLASGEKLENKMRVTGGQARNPLWMQIKADMLGINLEVPQCPDAELSGNAIIAYTGLHFFETIKEGAEQIAKPSQIYFPRGTNYGCV